MKILYKGTNPLFIGSKKLMQGEHFIEKELFKSLMRNEAFNWRVENGVISILEEDFEEEEVKGFEESNKTSLQEDIEEYIPIAYNEGFKVISESTDRDFLQKIINFDTRERLVSKAKERLQKLEG